MEILNRKLSLLKGKVENSQPITIMIIGLGSVGCYLLDYLVSLGDSQLRLVVVGRNAEKMQMDINIIRTASTIRHQCRSEIKVVDICNLSAAGICNAPTIYQLVHYTLFVAGGRCFHVFSVLRQIWWYFFYCE